MKNIVISMLLSAAMVFSGAGVNSNTVRILNLENGTIGVCDQNDQRTYAFSSGDQVVMGRVDTEGSTVADIVELPVGSATIRYFEPSTGAWVEKPLTNGTYTASAVEIVQADQTFFCYLPKTYLEGERETLTYLPDDDGSMTVTGGTDGWTVTLTATGPEGAVADYTWMTSSDGMLDWFHETYPEDWYNYTQDGEGKWCFDGYYRTTPDTYEPTGPDSIYRCPASYVVHSIAEAAEDRQSAQSLALAMADTLIQNQNSQGFWETGPESEWLSGDYGVGPGFFDTRFNTEMAEVLCTLYLQTGGDFLEQALERYSAFFLDFAGQHHQETENGGWMVEDYWDDDVSAVVHTSLNHQLAECLNMYHLADALERSELRQLADRMLLAVEDTASEWITADGNLHYRYNGDGTYGGNDYPYLTYNDLLYLQQYLQSIGQDCPELGTLMEAKRGWMDANGIKDYAR